MLLPEPEPEELEELVAAGAAGALAGAAAFELLFDALFEPPAAAPDEAPELVSVGEPAPPLSVAAGFASAAVVPGATSAVLAPPLLLLLRKSVTYQPEPLSWKPAAVTCLA